MTNGEKSMIITICIGSGCHVRGSRQIISILQELIDKYHLEAKIELEACFCQERCTEGVVVKIDDVMVTGVSKENITEIFHQKILEVFTP
jgi:NADH:ubiquinone oxidoreductase subunit E